ncbi:MAG: SBBP repeat-containing protein, partial [Gemmataceae bacterium]|nr:SBBP repeat-containing protein [Gemmataceae bacterium]
MIAQRPRWFPRNRRPNRWRAPLSLEPLESRFLPSITPFGNNLPLSFESNQGQAGGSVEFLARGPGYDLFLLPNEAVLTLVQPASPAASAASADDTAGAVGPLPLDMASLSSTSVIHLQLVGASDAPQIAGLGATETVSNYFLGEDPSQWLTGIVNYSQVEYLGIYPGIDVVFHGNPTELQYDFTVAPGADPGQIQLKFAGADHVDLDPQGNVVIHTGTAEVLTRAPFIYQDVDGVRQQVDGGYVLLGDNQVGFEIGSYDVSLPLVIDPTLTYSTYSGGAGTDYGLDIAVDGSGNIYVTGLTNSTDFPTAGPFQGAVGGGVDAYVTKLNPAGTARLYSTYFGGSGDDRAFGIAVDGSDNAYITGYTTSANLPLARNGVAGQAIQAAHGGGTSDGFVAKLNAAGTALVYSTYLGGSGAENSAGLVGLLDGAGIAVDAAGNAWVTGMTASTNFPTVNPRQGTFGGGAWDGYVTRVNTVGTALDYSTYLGGSGDDRGQGIAVDSAGKAYAVGRSNSANFPTTSGVVQPANKGGFDAYATKFDASLTGAATLVHSTLLGSNADDHGGGIAVDGVGNAYVTGLASGAASVGFPTTPGAFQAAGRLGFDVFVTKLNATASGMIYSTLLGGAGTDYGLDIAVDAAGNAAVTGLTSSSDFPLVDPVQASLGNFAAATQDAYITRLNATGTPYYSTYLGGTGDDRGQGLALDAFGNVYVAGLTTSANFPTAAPLQASSAGGTDAFVIKLTDAANHAPVIGPIGTQAANKGTEISIDAGATDADLGNPGAAGAVSWWRAEGNANDSLSGINGTLTNGATIAAGKVGQAFALDGVNDYVDVGGSFTVSGARTITAWVYPNANIGGAMPIITSGVSGQGDFWNIASGDAATPYEIMWDHWGFSTYHSGLALTPGTWNFVALAYDPNISHQVRFFLNDIEVFADGNLYNTDINTFAIGGNTIGGTTTNPSLNGAIDEVTYYNRFLSATEILAIYNQTSTVGLTYSLEDGPAGAAIDASGVVTWTPPPTDAVGWWPGEGDGVDVVGGNDGSLENGATIAVGNVGQAFSFTSSLNSKLVVANAPNLSPTEAITLEAWVKPASLPNAFSSVFRKFVDGAGNTQYILAITDTGQAHVNIGGFANTTGGIVPLNQWTHLAATYDRSMVRLYVNGMEVASVAATAAIPAGSGNLVIGNWDFGSIDRSFDGLIDEPAVFSRVLSAAEIQAIHAAASDGKGSIGAYSETVTVLATDNGSPSLSGTRTFNIAVNAAASPAVATPTPDAAGNAVQLDGMNDYVTVPYHPSLDDSRNVTISGWFKADGYPREWQNIFFRGKENNGINFDAREYAMWLHWGGELHVSSTPVNRVGNSGQVTIFTAPVVTLGRWHHFAAVISADLGVMRLYVDGDLAQEVPYLNAGSDIRATDAPLHFSYNWNEFQGSIDEVRLYHSVRTQEQIVEEMNRPLTPAEAASQEADPDVRLAGYWKFDEAGAVAFDQTSNQNHARMATPDHPEWVANGAGHLVPFPGAGGALRFDGVNDRVDVANEPSVAGTSAFTGEAWIYPTDIAKTHHVIFSNEGEYILAYGTDASLWLGLVTPTGPGWNWVDTNVQVPLTQWSHVALTYDGSFIRVWVNGVQSYQLAASGNIFDADTNLNDFYIGGREPRPEFFAGSIDEVRIWSVARTDFSDRNQALVGDEPNLIGYWNFNTDGGSVTADSRLAPVSPRPGDLTQDFGITSTAGALTGAPDPAYQIENGQVDLLIPQLNTTAGGYNTVSFWMKWNGWENVMPVGFNLYDLRFAGGFFGFDTGNDDIYGISSAGLADTWVHVTAAFHNGGGVTQCRLWINGVEQALTQLRGTPIVRSVGTQARISGWPPDAWNRLYGYLGDFSSIDEVAFFNRAPDDPTNPIDINKLKNGGSATYADDVLGEAPVAYYRLNDAPASPEAADVSGNANHGRIGSRPLTETSGAYLFSAPTSVAITVTNTADAGPGSLRQAILDANAVQGGLPVDISFDIPTTDPGYDPDTKVFTITPITALPAITSPFVAIDGRTQFDRNTGTLGAGGTVGVGADGVAGTGDELILNPVDRPDIQIVDVNNVSIGLNVAAGNVTIRGLAIYGFGNLSNNGNEANIRIQSGVTGTIIEDNVIGASASSFSDPGPGLRSGGVNVHTNGAGFGILRNNLIGFSAGHGVQMGNATNWLVQGNEIRTNALETTNLDGIANPGTATTIIGNLVAANQGGGIDATGTGVVGLTITDNTITFNGALVTGGPGAETYGIRLFGSGGLVSHNVISNNFGAGIQVNPSAQGNAISQNSIFDNGVAPPQGGVASGQIGIDLLSSSDNASVGTAPFRTPNDPGDPDAGGNGLLNAPVITSARSDGTNLTVTGFATPGSTIELFTANPDPSGFGEGQTYLATRTVPIEGPFAGSDSALSFRGAGDYVELPAAPEFSDFTGGLTIEVWAYPTAVYSWQRFIDFGNGPAGDNILFARQGTSNNLAFEVYVGGTWSGQAVASNVIELNKWQHFAVVMSPSGAVSLYKDGNLLTLTNGQTSATLGVPRNVTRTQNFIGRSNWVVDGYYAGLMDDVRIWNSARTQGQIQAGMNQQLVPASEANLVAYHTFDEGTGLAAADAANGNDGDLISGSMGLPAWVETATPGSLPTGSYSSATLGSDTTTTFTLVIPLTDLAAGVAVSDQLSATATFVGATSEFGHNVTVKTANAAPDITTTTLTPQIDENGFATLTVNYTDADLQDGHIATIDWGDGDIQTVELTGPTVVISDPVTFQDHTYYFVYTGLNWYQAEAQAQLMGGHLVTIGSRAENDFVRDLILEKIGTAQAWLGMTDADNEGVWRWVTGEPITFANFLTPGEPNNSGFFQDHAYINFGVPANAPGFWDDAEGRTSSRVSVIEVGPEKTFTLTHQYKNDGNFTVDVTLADDDGLDSLDDAASAAVTVREVAPAFAVTTSGPTAVQKTTPVGGDQFGTAAAIVGNTLYVGAHLDDTGGIADAGAVYAYDAATGAATGTVIRKDSFASGYGLVASDQFGIALAAFGDKLLIGANLDDTGATDAGAVYLYDPDAGTLTRIANPFPAVNDQFGISIAAVGANFVVGAHLADNGAVADAGAAYLFDGGTLGLLQVLKKSVITTADSSGNNNTGTLWGTLTRGVAGALPNDADAAFELRGGRVAATIPQLNQTSGGYNTVSFWMKWNGGNTQMPIGFTSYDLFASGGFFGFNTGNGNIYGFSSSIVGDNQWHLITAVFQNLDGTNAVDDLSANQIWVDGVQQTLAQVVGSTPANLVRNVGAEARISGWTNDDGYRLGGSIDEAAFFNRQLSPADIAALWNARFDSDFSATVMNLPSGEGAPVAYYRLGDGPAGFVDAAGVNDQFGFVVDAAANNQVLVGAPLADVGKENMGAVYVYNASSGGLVRTLTNPFGIPLETHNNNFEQFGQAVAGVGDYIVVGAPLTDMDGTNVGWAYVFDAATGTLLRSLQNPNPTAGDQFGLALTAVGADKVLIGAPFNDRGATDAGAAHLFNVATGELLALFENPAPGNDRFGAALAATDTRLVIAAPLDDGPNNSGSAFLYQLGAGLTLSPATISEGGMVTVTGSFVDPGRQTWLADSISQFSLVQGQHNWYYGYYATPGDTSSFTLMNYANGKWSENPTQPPWTLLRNIGGHPNGTDTGPIHWAARRWISPVTGTVTLSGLLAKENTGTFGDGIRGRIFVDGVEVYNQTIAGTDGVGVTYSVTVSVSAGMPIDFLIDPITHAGQDGTRFTATITTADDSEPHTATIVWGDGATTMVAVPALPQTPTAPLSGPYSYGGHTYYAIKDGNITWQEAASHAERMGGHLIAINSAGESQFAVEMIRQEYGGNPGAWIGMSDTAASGVFAWASGDPVYHTRWASGQPANTAGVDGAAMNQGGVGNWTTFAAAQLFNAAIIEIDGKQSFTAAHQYTDNLPDNAAYAVSVTVDDGDLSDQSTTTVGVNNVAPVVNAGPDVVLNSLGAFTSAGSFTDPGADTWTATVNWGDSPDAVPLALNPDKTFDLNHTYAADGVYTVTVTVTDDDGGTHADMMVVTVHRFTVDTMADTVANDGVLTLREAIENANANPGLDTISFNIPGGGVRTISPTSALPTITDAVTIDGYSQPGASANTLAVGNDAVVLIELSGTSAGAGVSGLTIDSAGSTIKGLVVNRFGGDGIRLTGPGATGNVIEGNFIGTDAGGAADLGNTGNGVLIQSGAASNRIGTNGDGVNDFAERNVISGNASGGNANVNIIGAGTDNNTVAGNYVGLNAAGTAGIAGARGIRIAIGAASNTIGTDGSNDAFNANERNIVSGNGAIAIFVAGGSNDNVIAGNWIGLNAAGTASIGNSGEGVNVSSSARTRIGTNADGVADAAEANVIVGSGGVGGILLEGLATQQTVIAGNMIGTNPAGTLALPNTYGITLGNSANNNTIGGTSAAERNVISGNSGAGIWVVQQTFPAAPDNIIQGNFIGTDGTGTLDLGNLGDGILIENNPNTTIGGAVAGTGNVISGNDGDGIRITGSGSTGNLIQGNYIGTNAAGTAALGNSGEGVDVDAAGNTIGGSAAGAGNVIASNQGPDGGVLVHGSADGTIVQGNSIGTSKDGLLLTNHFHQAYGVNIVAADNNQIIGNVLSGNQHGVNVNQGEFNHIEGNLIGTDPTGTVAVPNTSAGVRLAQASNNTVGGTAAAARNIISGNVIGVSIDGSLSTANIIAGNYIGTMLDGDQALGNGTYGVFIGGGAHGNTIAGTAGGAGNVVSGNQYGIYVSDAGTDSNTIQGNLIGTNAAGDGDLGNAGDGIAIVAGAFGNLIGGVAAGEANTIAYNAGAGVSVSTGGLGNRIRGNSIHSNDGLGIDLADDGVTANDAGDGDSGPNNLQNFPVLAGASVGASTHVAGTLNSTANTQFTIDFYASAAADPSGFGEGQRYLGSTTVTTDGSGNADFDLVLPSATTVGEAITATATDPAGNTSEFSAAVIATDFVVTSTADSGPGTLRDIIVHANALDGLDTITFNIAGAGVHTISVLSALPTITEALVIDGYSQPGASPNTLNVGGNAVLLIELNGASAGTLVNGLTVSASGSTIQGLIINRFLGHGMFVSGSNNVIQGNYVGTNAAGTSALGNGAGAGGIGIVVQGASNTIGGTTAAARNVVSGNLREGISLGTTAAHHNLVQGNYVGTNAAGTARLPNGSFGVNIGEGGDNLIGGTAPGAGNLISGNNRDGIGIGGIFAHDNQVVGNFIGTNASGTAALFNSLNGIFVGAGVRARIEGNLISGNLGSGVHLAAIAPNNTVVGNFIGTTTSGSGAIANLADGIFVAGSGNTIGGLTTAARNVIAGNSGDGVEINGSAATHNAVQGNYIGTDVAGTAALPNSGNGITINSGANHNTIGGGGAGNVISGNDGHGIEIVDSGTSDNVVAGNYIGTDKDGTAPLGNALAGIHVGTRDIFGPVNGASNNLIGGNTPAARNIISGNGYAGVSLDGAGTTGNVVSGNYIGTDKTGMLPLGNAAYGVRLFVGPTGNTIGGDTAGEGNVISGNTDSGVNLNEANANTVSGNYIGVAADGSTAMPNMNLGITVHHSSNNVIGGDAPGERNVISGNLYLNAATGSHTQVSISSTSAVSSGNRVIGNYIGTDWTGNSAVSMPGSGSGLIVLVAAGGTVTNNFIGGTGPGEGNVISTDTTSNGVFLRGVGVEGNQVLGNIIGLNAAGTTALGAGLNGVTIDSGAANNVIGDLAANAGNVISGNGLAGVAISDAGTSGNVVRGNSIFANGGLGIDLLNGGNNLINFPVQATAYMFGGVLTLTGAAPAGAAIDFYIADPDPTGFGEGQTYLFSFVEGSLDDLDAAAGSYIFTLIAPVNVVDDTVLTATATVAGSGTSEFSGNLDVREAPTEANISVVPGHAEDGSELPVTHDALGRVLSVRGQAMLFELTAVDASPADQAAPFTFRVNWGDGTEEDLTVTSGTHVLHIYRPEGAFPIQLLSVTDRDGSVLSSAPTGAGTPFVSDPTKLTVNNPLDAADDAVFTQKVAVVSGGYTLLVGAATTGSNVVLTQQLATQR